MSMRPDRVRLFTVAVGLLVLGAIGTARAPAAGEGPFRVQHVFPNAQTYSALPPNALVCVTFSRPADPATVTTSTFFLSPSTPATVSYDPGSRTAIVRPSAILGPGGASYTATVTRGIKAEDGAALEADYSWSFSVWSAADETPPEVRATVPADADTDVARNRGVQVFFSEMLDPSTINVTTFRLSPSVAGVVSYDGASRAATFRPLEDLEPGTSYVAILTSGITDAAGNSLGSDETWQFTTGSARDEERPRATSLSPPDGTTVEEFGGTAATAIFSEPMDVVSFRDGTVLVDGQPEEDVTYDPGSHTATIGTYTEGTHRIRITTGVKDLAGNPLASEASWSFRVEAVDICDTNPDLCEDLGGGGTGGCFLNALRPRRR